MNLHDCRELKSLGEYERLMKRFEVVADGATLPDMFLIIRADAHRHTDQWSDEPDAEYPFGDSFVASLRHTAIEVMKTVGRFRLAYMHGDEISFLVEPRESRTERRRVRLASLVASATAASFVQKHEKQALFHCVLSELPTVDHVASYFLWQRKVAERNYISRLLSTSCEALFEEQPDLRVSLSQQPLEERITFLREQQVHVPPLASYERTGALFALQGPGEVIEFESVADDADYLTRVLTLLDAPALPSSITNTPSRPVRSSPKGKAKKTAPRPQSGPFRIGHQKSKLLPGGAKGKKR